MKRIRLRMTALLIALLVLATALPALPALAEDAAGTEYNMLSYQTGAYSHGTNLAALYNNALFSGVLFNGGKAVDTSAPGRDAMLGDLDAFKTTPDADDITYYYFVGTGYLKDGVAGIQLSDGGELPLTGLSAALGAVPGKICVILDVKAAGVTPASFNQQVAQAFSADKFQYLSACSATDAAFGGAPVSRATRFLLTGFGQNVSTYAQKAKNWPADTNKNYAVTLKEAASYLKGQSKKLNAADFALSYRAAGNGPNLFACTGVTSLSIFTADPVTTRDAWTEIYMTATPANADYGSFLLSSSKPWIASIQIYSDPGAEIHTSGTTVLTAKSRMYPYPKATYKLKVLPIPSESVLVRVNGKEVAGQTVDAIYGTDLEPSANVLPADSDFQRLTWSSSNKKVALIEGDDYYDGRKAYIYITGIGTSVITATAEDGVQASFTLNVPHVAVESLNPVKDVTLPLGKKTYCGTVTQPEGTILGVAYKSSNLAVATIDSKGYVFGKKLGTTVITVTSVDNPTVKIQYTVTIARDECVWPAPDPAALGDGMFFKPKKLSYSGNTLVCEVYFVNNTPAPVSKISVARIGVKETENINSTYTEYRGPLRFSKPVPAGKIGTYTFKFNRSERMSSSAFRISDFILPQGTLEPFATIQVP